MKIPSIKKRPAKKSSVKKQILCSLFPIAALAMSLSSPAVAAVENFTFNPALSIPDGNLVGTSTTVTPGSLINVIQNVTVGINLTGTPLANSGFNGDLYVYLSHITPGGSGITVLLNRVGLTAGNPNGFADSGFNITLSDAGAADVHVAGTGASPVTGTFQADGRNISPVSTGAQFDAAARTTLASAFNGLSAKGGWTLFLADASGGNQQVLNSWTLNLTGVAGSFFWKGGTNSSWSTIGTNWATDINGATAILATPDATSDVTFSATGGTGVGAGGRVTTLGADIAIKNLIMSDTVGAVQINGANTLTLSGASGTGIDVQAGAQALTIGANLNMGTSDTVNVSNAAGATINGVISGTTGLKKTGTGTLTLGGVNTYTGATNVNAGTLSLAAAGSIAAGSTVAVGTSGTLTGTGRILGNATLALGGIINFSGTANTNNIVGSLGVTGGSWNGVGIVGGSVNVTSGTLNIGSGANLTTNGTVNVSGTGDLLAAAANSTITGNVNVTSSSNMTYAGVIAGATTTVTVNDPVANARLFLNGTNTYGGLTTVTAGELDLGSANGLGAIGAGAGTIVQSGGCLYIFSGISVVAEDLNITGAGSVNFPDTKAALVGQNLASFAGAVTLGGDASIGVISGATFTLTGGINANGKALTLTNSQNGTSGTITLNTVGIVGGAGTSVIVDRVTVNENVANTYNGPTFIRSNLAAGSGILNANVANALPTANGRSAVTLDDAGLGGSKLVLGADQSIASLTGAATSSVNLGTNTLTIGAAAGTTTFAGVISGTGTGSLTKDGASTQVLTGTNAYSSSTSINGGTLSISNNGALGTSQVIVNNTGSLLTTATFALTNLIVLNSGSNVSAAAGTVLSLSPSQIAFGSGNRTFGSAGSTGVVGVGNLAGSIVVNSGTIEVAFGTLRNLGGGASDLGFVTANVASTTVDAGATLDVNDNSMTVKSLLGAGNVTLGVNAATNLTVNSGTYSGVMSGAGNLIKDTAGTFQFSGGVGNTFTGITTVKDGNLFLNRTVVNQTLLGNVFIGDSVGAASSAKVTLGGNGQIGNSANMTIRADGQFNMAGFGEAVNNLTITDGNVVNVPTDGVNDLGIAGNLVMTGGSINGGTGATAGLDLFGAGTGVTATSSATTGAAAINSNVSLFGATRTFTVNRGPAALDLIITGVVQDATGGITKTGLGFMQLAGLNTYNGQTNVNAGKLIVSQNTVGSFSALGFGNNTLPNGTVVSGAGSILELTSGTSITNEFLQLNNGGQFKLQAPGGTATWGGTIQIVGGPGTLDAFGGTLNVGSIDKTDVNLTLTDSLNSAKGVAVINVNGAITGNNVAYNDDLLVTGVTANLNAANTYLGPTHISSTASGGGVGGGNGVLNANVAGAMPLASGRTAVDMDQSGVGGSTLNIGGTLAFPAGASQAIASLVGTANSSVTLGSNTLTIGFGTAPNTNGTANAVFAGVISGSGGIFKDDTSTQILIGANTYLGQTRVNAGTLQIGDGSAAAVSIAASVPVIVDAAGTLAINLVNNGTFTNNVTNNGSVRGINTTGNTQTISGVISSAGNFLQNAGGTTIFTNINTYQGGTGITNASNLGVGSGALQGSVGTGAVSVSGGGGLSLINVNGNVFPNNVSNTVAGLGTVFSSPGLAVTTTISGALTSSGGAGLVLNHNGAGTTILTNAGNTFSGAALAPIQVSVTFGTLQIGTVGSPSFAGANVAGANNQISVGSGGTLTLVNVGGNTLNNSVLNNVNGSGTLNVNSANNNTLAGALVGGGNTLALTQTGTGTTTLSNGSNNLNAGTTVSAGGLTIGTAGSASTVGAFNPITVGTGGTLTLVNLVGNIFANNVTNTLGGSGLVNVNSTNNNFLDGILANTSGTLALTQIGSGTTTVRGANTYTGATLVSGGTLQIGNGTLGSIAAGSAVTVNAGAFLDLNLANGAIFANNVADNGTMRGINTAGNTQTVSGIVSGTGAFVQNAGGRTIFSNINTYQGGTTISNASTVNVGSGAQPGSLGAGAVSISGNTSSLFLANVNGGVFPNNVSNTVGGAPAIISAPASPASFTLTGALTDSGGAITLAFVQFGTGTSILTNAGNTYSGGTTVSAGTLQIGAAGSPSQPGSNVAGNSILVNNGGVLSIVNLNGGTLNNNINNSGSGIGTVNVNSATPVTLAGNFSVTAGNTLALTQTGAGTTTLTGATNVINGGVTVSNGGLTIGTAGTASRIDAAGTASVNVGTGGTFTLVNLTAATFANSIGNTLGGAGSVVVNSANPVTLSGVISNASGTLSLTQSGAGTTTLTGANTYTGVTNVNAGTLQIGNNTSGNIQSPQINIASGATLGVNLATGATLPGNISNSGTVNANIAAGTQTLGGIIGGSGVFTQSGAGTTNLTGISTYTGATTVSAGTLRVNGALGNTAVTVQTGATLGGSGIIGGLVSIQSGGHIAAGNSPGTLTVASLSLVAGSNSDFELNTPGVIGQAVLPGNDLINVTGNLTLAGNINVIPNPTISAGSYRLFNYGSLTNNGTTLLPSPVGAGLSGSIYLGVAGQVNLLVLNSAAIGLTQFWDGGGVANDSVIAGGSGTWDGFQNNWTNAGGNPNAAWQNGVATFAGAAGTVTLASTVNAQGLVFATNGYQINGSGGFTLNLVGPTPAPTITVSPGLTATINAPITGANGLTADGAGTLVLTNTGNSFTGGVTVTNGIVSVSADGNLGNSANALTLNNGTLQTTATFASARGVTLTGTSTFDVTNANTFTESGIIGGAGALSKSNTGTLVLSGANTYAGPTNILDGTVSVSANGNLGNAAGGVTFGGTAGSNAVLKTTAGINFINRPVTLNTGGGTVDTNGFASTLGGIISGVAGNAFTKAGGGTLTVTGASTYLGQTNVNAGTLQVGDGATLNTKIGNNTATVVVNNGGTLGVNLPNLGNFGNPVTVNAGGAVIGNNTAGAQAVSGVISGGGSVTQSGAGTTILTAPNTYTGPTLVSAGTLQIGDGAAIGSSIANSVSTTVNVGGTLAVNLTGISTFTNNVLNNGTVNSISATLQIFSGVISGSGVFNQNGGFSAQSILTGNNTYTGVTTIAANNTLGVGFSGNTGTLGTGNVSNSGTLNFNRSNTMTVANLISGNGFVRQIGAGTTILTAANTYSGPTFVMAGTLQIGDGTTPGASIAGSSATNVLGGSLTVNLVNGETFLNNVLNNASVNGISSGTQTLSGNITGNGVLNQNGTGTMILTGANSYSGVTTISTGTLQIGAGAAAGMLGAGNVTDNGALVFNRSDSITVGNLISGSGTLRQQGTVLAATTTLTAANTYSGATTVTSGTLQIGNGGAVGSSIVNSVSTTVNAGAALAINLANGETFLNSVADGGAVNGVNTGANVQTLAGIISGNGTVNQTGTGTTILTGTNTYGGTTTISAGTLQIGSGGAIGTIGSGNVTDNGALIFNRSNLMTVANTISGTGTVRQQGGGITVLTATNTYSGATTVAAGTLQIGDGSTPGASIAPSGQVQVTNGTLAVNLASGSTFTNGVNLQTVGTTSLNAIQSGTNTLSGVITGPGALNQSGTGTTILTANNNYSGTTTINAGTLQVGAGAAAGSLGTGNVVDNGALVFNRSDAITVANVISGSGTLTQQGAGTTTLTGADTYSGVTNVTAGTLQIGDGTSGNITSPQINVSGGATLAVRLANNATLVGNIANTGTINAIGSNTQTLSGNISGTGVFNQSGTGITVLTGTSNYTGATTVSNGNLRVNGILGNTAVTVQSGATLSGTGSIGGNVTILSGGNLNPGTSPGTITMGSLTLNAGSNLNFELGTAGVIGQTVLPGNDLVNVNGNLTLDGNLNVTPNPTITSGSYRLFNYTGTLTNNIVDNITGVGAAFTPLIVTAAAGQVNLLVLANGSGPVQVWDGAGPANNGVANGGSGNWDNFAANWTGVAGANPNASWQNGIAVFNAPQGTVTITDTVNAQGLIFGTNGYVINGSAGNSLNLVGQNPAVNNVPFISVTNAGDVATINAVVSNFYSPSPIPFGLNGGLTSTGAGKLVLTNIGNNYTGGTTISGGGTVSISNDQNLGAVPGALGVNDITLNNGVLQATATFTLNSNRSIILAGAGGIDVTGPDRLTYGGVMSGAGSLTKIGTGILTLSGVNTYTGGTGILGGTLEISNNNNLGAVAGGLTFGNGATLKTLAGITSARAISLNGGAGGGGVIDTNGFNSTLTGIISGAAGNGLVKNGVGVLTVTGASTYLGTTTINAGTLQVGDNATAGAQIGNNTANVIVGNGATLDVRLTNGGTFNNTINNVLGGTINSTNNAGTTQTFGGVISGAGVFNQNGAGTVVLNGANTYSGLTTVNAGTLRLGHATALGTTGAGTVVVSGATLDLNGQLVGSEALSIAGAGVGGNGALINSNLAAPASLSGPVTLQGTTTITTQSLDANATSGGSILLSGNMDGGFGIIKNGNGTLTLSGLNIYTGTTQINAGILQAGNTFALGSVGANTVVESGASLQILSNVAVIGEPVVINGFGAGTAAPGALTQQINGSSSLAGPITVATNANISTNGTGTLTLTGGITKNGTTLTLNGGGNIKINNVGISGATSFTSDLVIDGTGVVGLTVVDLNVASSYAGPTWITNGGTLNANVLGALPSKAADGLGGIGTIRTTVIMDPIAAIPGTPPSPSPSSGGSILNLGASQAIQSLTGAVSSRVNLGTNTLTIGTAAGTTTFAGVISGANAAGASIVKDGSSTQIFGGPGSTGNTYTGSTTVIGGTLQAGVANTAFGVNSATTVGTAATVGNATLDLAGFSNTIGSLAGNTTGIVRSTGGVATLTTGALNTSTDFAGVLLDGAGGQLLLIKNGTGTQTLSGTAANTFTGLTLVNAGELDLNKTAGVNAIGGNLTIGDGAAAPNSDIVKLLAANQIIDTSAVLIDGSSGGLDLNNFDETIASLADTGTVIVNGSSVNLGSGKLTFGDANSLTFSGAITGVGGKLVKNGTGTQTLAGTTTANTFSGLTTVNAGEIDLNKTAGTLAIGGNLTIGDGLGGANSDIVKLLAANQIISTSLVLINGTSGRLDLNGNSQTVGSVADTGVVTPNGSSINLGSGTLTTGAGGGANPANPSTAFSGVISGTNGNLTKTGTGTFTLNGTNTYTGATLVSAGTLRAGSTQAFGLNSPVTVSANSILDLAGNSNTIGSLAGGGAGSFVRSSTGAATLTVSGLSNTAYTGVVQDNVGKLSLVKNGAGIQTLSGTNTYTGTTTVNGGTLLAGSASAFGINSATTVNAGGTLDLGGNSNTLGSLSGVAGGTVQNSTALAATLTTGTLGTNTAFAGTVKDGAGAPLTFVKTGAGTQILSGTNSYTGGTVLNAGTLAAGSTKAFGSGNLTVNLGTLRTNGGTLIVDIGGGALSINGGTVAANVGGTVPGATHDQIRTTGNVGAIAGTLVLVQQGGYLLAPGDKVNLVAAGNVAGGTALGTPVPAANVTGLGAFSVTPLLVPTVNLYFTTVTLEAMQGSFAGLGGVFGPNGQFIGFTPNQLATARALDSVAAGINFKTGILKELNYLDTQPLGTLPGNLDKIAPEEFAAFFQNSVALANVQSANLGRHLDDLRSGSSAPSASGLAAAGSGPSYSGGLSGPAGKRSKEIAPANDERWGAFLTGSGEFTHVGSTTNAAGYHFETAGVTGGVDYRVNDHFAIGMSFGYVGTTSTLVNGGKIDTDGGRLGLYATYFDKNFHVDAAVTGGLNSYDTRRTTPNNTSAIASPDGSEINVLIAAGYHWKVGKFTVGPTASYQYTNVHTDGFTETGAFAPLSVSGQSTESSRTSLGIRAYYDAQVAGIVIRPEVRLSWQHEFGDAAPTVTSRFSTLGGNPFTVTGPQIGRDSLLLGAGFTILWSERFATYLYYDGEVGRSNYDSHNISGGIRLQF